MRVELCKSVCSTCGVIKTKHNTSSYSNGNFRTICKSCRNKDAIRHGRTKEGVANEIYNGQRKSEKKGTKTLHYSRNELYTWLLAQEKFLDLFDEWVISGYETDKKPSVDRIEDTCNYKFSNLQVMTWKENRDKSFKDRASGRNPK